MLKSVKGDEMDENAKKETIHKIRRIKNIVKTIGVTALVGGYMGLGEYTRSLYENKDGTENTIDKDRFEKFRPIENELIAAIALMENFSDKVYHCGVRHTVGFGTTKYPDGKRVAKGDPAITKKQGETYLLAALNRGAFPCINKWVNADLTNSQLIGLSMFIYNIGTQNFTGINDEGKRFAPEAKLLMALNDGESTENCARYFTGFRAIGGKRSEGLLKRRWWEAAVFTGKIAVEDLLQLDPGKIYGNVDLKEIYKSTKPDKDNFFTPNFDEKLLAKMLKNCRGDEKKCLAAILDKETALALGDTIVYKGQQPVQKLAYNAAKDFKGRGR